MTLFSQRRSVFFMHCLMLLGLTLYSTQAVAAKDWRPMDENDFKRLTDNRTFWRMHHFDRMYFNADGTFTQQLNDGWESIQDGSTLTGTWAINDDQLCWTYDAATAEAYQTTTNPYCYTGVTDTAKTIFMTTHLEKIRLFRAGSSSMAFEWHAWMHGDYILDPDYVAGIKEAFQTMSQYRGGGGIPAGTIVKDEMNKDMQSYYDLIADRIFYVGPDLLFFGKDGSFFYTTTNTIKKAGRDVDAMKRSGATGTWQIKDNIHCWYLQGNKSSCEYVLPEGKGLMRAHNSRLGIHHNAFTRLYSHKDVGHIDPSQTAAPALFDALIKAQ